MKQRFWNSIPLGLVLGLITPLVILLGINVFNFPQMSFGQFLGSAYQLHTLGTWLLPALLFNLAVFFLFINFNKLYSARGVVFATITYGLFIVFLFFLS